MKIIYCIPSTYNSGGMERVLSNKANYLAEKLKFDVTIITTNQNNKTPYFKFSPLVKHHDLKLKSINFNQSFFKKKKQISAREKEYEKKLNAVLLELKADIVISMFNIEMDFLYKINDGSKKLLEIHFAKNVRQNTGRKGYKKILDIIPTYLRIQKDYDIIKKYDKFIVLTEEDKRNWPLYLEKNISVISNPIPIKAEETALLENKTVLSVGRLTEQKGFDMLIDAWKIIYNSFPEWKLKIVGEGELFNDLQNQINKSGLDKVIIIEPFTKNIQAKYLESSIYAMSSRYEGFPMVLLETMEFGLPCVSFNCKSGPSEIIKNNEDGFIVEDGNIRDLAEKIIYLMENDEKRKIMGSKAHENIQRFSEEKIMKKWISLFNQITK